MKRWIALGMAVMMVLGIAALAWGADPDPVTKEVELIIGDACEFDQNPGWEGWFDDADLLVDPQSYVGEPGTTGEFYKTDLVSGRSNHECCVTVTIDGPFTSYASHSGVIGKTLQTSFWVNGQGTDNVPAGGGTYTLQFPHNTVDGTFSFTMKVDVVRKGWADHEGTYKLTITYSCGPC